MQTSVMRKMNIGVIYLLLDAAGVRYVGQTTRNPRERLSQHLSKDVSTHKGAWLRSLKSKGEKPRMLVYRVASLDGLDQAEITLPPNIELQIDPDALCSWKIQEHRHTESEREPHC